MPNDAAANAVPCGTRARLRARSGFFVAFWLLLLGIGRERLFRDPGTFWHTVVGGKLLTTGEFIRLDPFTFTFAGKPWIPHQWLGECVMALAHRIGGLDTLLLLAATLLAALLSWIAQRLMRGGLHWARAALLVAWVFAVSASHLHVRPHLATLALLAVTVAALIDVEASRKVPAHLLWLVPVFVLWTNMHGGVLAGLGTLLLVLPGWILQRWRGRPTPLGDTRSTAFALGATALCFAAILVNPYGTLLPRTWLAIVQSPTLTRIIVEHRPLSLASLQGVLVLLLALLYLAALASSWRRGPRVVWFLPLVFLYLAFARLRHAPLFALTTVLVLADMLPHSVLGRAGERLSGSGAGCAASALRRLVLPWLLPASLVVTSLALQAARVEVPLIGRAWVRLDPDHWPVELLDELRAHEHDRPSGTRIFNDYLYGGFLIYFTPGYRVFVDDRCELYRSASDPYPDAWLDQLVKAESERTAEHIHGWERRYGRFDLALVKTRPPAARVGFDVYFSTAPRWQLLKRTRTATLYRRRL